MNIESASDLIIATLINLEMAVGEPVFDEWAIAEKMSAGWKIHNYGGNRNDEFLAKFDTDLAALKKTLDPDNLQIGDFAFSHDGFGSGFDAHICAGENLLVLLNNTSKSTDEITSNPEWTDAQRHFGDLLEHFIANPIA